MPRKPISTASPDLPDPAADVGGLRAFVAIARLGTVGRAAARLGRTQPSISARLAELERRWATTLFRRGPKGMRLTPEGRRLLPRAEAALEQLVRLDEAAGLPVTPDGELRLGAGDALGRHRLPRALAPLLRSHPDLEVHLREGSGSSLLDSLVLGEIDLALVIDPGAERAWPALDLQPWIRSGIDLLAPAGLLRPGRRALRPRDLADRRLIALQPDSGFRRRIEADFLADGVRLRPSVEVGNLSLVRRFVGAGLGVAPVPSIAFTGADLGRGLERHPMKGLMPIVYCRAVRAGVPLSPIATDLLERLRGGEAASTAG